MKNIKTIASATFLMVVLAIITCELVALVPVGVRNYRRVGAAFEHAAILGQAITNDPCFREITISGHSGENGMIIVHGRVATQEDEQRLRSLILSSSPPVAVISYVDVGPGPVTNWKKPYVVWFSSKSDQVK